MREIDALDFRAERAEVPARGEPQLRACEFLCLSPSNPWPDKSFKLKAAYVPKHLSVYLNISNSPGVRISVSFLVTNFITNVILVNEARG